MGAPSGLFAAESTYLDRWVQIGVASGKVIRLSFHRQTPGGSPDHPLLERLIAYLDEGHQDDFGTVEIGLTVPTQERAVYEAVREIPFGTSTNLAAIAERIPTLDDGEESSTAVANALETNPIPVLVPDHRVDHAQSGYDNTVRSLLREREGID